MISALKKAMLVVGATGLIVALAPSAHAACLLVAGTSDALSKERAIEKSRAEIDKGVAKLKSEKGWTKVSIRAHRAEPDPLFKAVRTKVTPDLLVPPDVKSASAYSVCWRGVGSPVVCTSGAMVCGR